MFFIQKRLIALSLFLSVTLLGLPKVHPQYETGTDVLLNFMAQQINESAIKNHLGEARYERILQAGANWRVEDVQNALKALIAEEISPDAIEIIISLITNEFHFAQDVAGESAQTASEVILNFAMDPDHHITDVDELLDNSRLERLIEQTESWRAEDAHNLLDLLTDARIEPVVAVKAIVAISGFLQRATDVFVEFAQGHVTEGSDLQAKMNDEWIRKLNYKTTYWTAMQAHCFLDYLTRWIGAAKTAQRIISSPSVLWDIRSCEAFKARVALFAKEEYMGRENVRRKLSRTLKGFHTGKPENIESTIEKVERIMGSDKLKEFFNKPNPNIDAFTVVHTEIDEIVRFLEEDRRIPRDKIIEAMLDDMQAFTKGKLTRISHLVEAMEKRLKDFGTLNKLGEQIELLAEDIKTRIDAAILKNPIAFTLGRPNVFENLVDEMTIRLQSYGLPDRQDLSEDTLIEIGAIINEAFLRDPSALTQGRLKNFQSLVGEMTTRLQSYGLPDHQGLSEKEIGAIINETFLKSPTAFTMGRLENFQSLVGEMIARLQSYGLPDRQDLSEKEIGAIINEVFLRDPSAFTMGTLENFKSVVKYLKGKKISESLINELFYRNPSALTRLSINRLKALERRAGIDGLIQFLRSGSLEALEVHIASSPQGARVTQDAAQAPTARPRGTAPQQICSPPLLTPKE